MKIGSPHLVRRIEDFDSTPNLIPRRYTRTFSRRKLCKHGGVKDNIFESILSTVGAL